MTRKVFTKLMALFVLLLVFQTVVMELVLRRMVEHTAGTTLHLLGREALWSGLIALGRGAAAGGMGGAAASPARLQRVVAFARRIADGDLSARLDASADDELAAMETALNQTAERLGQSFAEIESRRHELATMLDSMQEAVVAITPEGYVRWSNAVMQRIAGHADSRGPSAGALGARSGAAGLRARRSGRAAKCALGAPVRWRRAASSRSTRRRCPRAARSRCCTT